MLCVLIQISSPYSKSYSNDFCRNFTLFGTKTAGVWIDEDVKALVGDGGSYLYTNIFCDAFMYRKKIHPIRNKIPALAHQYGCFATKYINVGVTLGWYTGIVYTENNYQKYGTLEKQDYAIKTHDLDDRVYVIEPFEDEMLLQWINDGSTNCNDVDICNVEFQECSVAGIPLIKVVSIKNILKNHQLFVDYGKDYWESREINDNMH